MKDKNVRFIRKNGRIIPVKVKGNMNKFNKDMKKHGATSTKDISKKEYSNVFKQTSKRDARIAKTGRKVGNFSGIAALGLGISSAMSKKGGFKRMLGATALGTLSLISHGGASGREMSSQLADEISRGVPKGKRKSAGIGGASERVRRMEKVLSKYVRNGSSV